MVLCICPARHHFLQEEFASKNWYKRLSLNINKNALWVPQKNRWKSSRKKEGGERGGAGRSSRVQVCLTPVLRCPAHTHTFATPMFSGLHKNGYDDVRRVGRSPLVLSVLYNL